VSVDLAIKGGTVVSPRGRAVAHVYASQGRVAHVGDEDLPAEQIVDASGLYVLPGMVDTHVHLMDPGSTDREDFPTGTAAAAAAGVTTIVEHTHATPIRTAADLIEKRSYLDGRSNVDFGLAAHVWPHETSELEALWRKGIAYFKLFTCTTHGVPGLDAASLEAAFQAIAAFGGACLVHCEDESLTLRAEADLRSLGREDGGLLAEWRSRQAEEVAVATVGVLAARTGIRATIAHVSSPSVADIIAWARSRGADLAAETCPQYLVLREGDVRTEGSLRKFTPPARLTTDEEEIEMWELLRSGVLTHVSTDHAPSTLQQKAAGIWDAPFGLPGLDTTSAVLLDGVFNGRLALEDVVRVYSEQPARRYGLFPRKGAIAVGSDADITLVDPDIRWKVASPDIISKAGWSPFDGRTLEGGVHSTYLRGRLVARGRQPRRELTGRFLAGAGAR